ncbi:hypothetical protein ElyMa_005397900 [Elysia marginata]|uniref:Uncharacterized protein n=1 Tax=Elysia marginata TaxID=1093978 RepID=A0AAV4EH71_9GAST|nr:hypothetical protein ElyMa_005397900 [Elysia marginata]
MSLDWVTSGETETRRDTHTRLDYYLVIQGRNRIRQTLLLYLARAYGKFLGWESGWLQRKYVEQASLVFLKSLAVECGSLEGGFAGSLCKVARFCLNSQPPVDLEVEPGSYTCSIFERTIEMSERIMQREGHTEIRGSEGHTEIRGSEGDTKIRGSEGDTEIRGSEGDTEIRGGDPLRDMK